MKKNFAIPSLMFTAVAASLPIAALALGPADGLGRDSLWFFGQLAVLLAVWSLAPDRRTRVYLALAAALTALSSAWLLQQVHRHPTDLGYSGPSVICGQWLLAALCAASAAARRVPESAPGLGRFKALAVLIAASALGLRLALLTLDESSSGISNSMETLIQLLCNFLFGFVGPLWLLWVSGRRRGVSFMAGLTLVIPAFWALWFRLALRGLSIETISWHLLRFDHIALDMLIVLTMLTALTALGALLRDRRGRPEPKPAGQLKLSAALIPAGAVVLAGFLALGWHQGRILPEAVPYAGPLKTVKFADMEIKVPVDFEVLSMRLKLDPEGWRLTEMTRTSAEEADKSFGGFMGLKIPYDEAVLARIREIEERTETVDGEDRPELAEFFKKGVLTGLGRDLSVELGRPARLTATVGRYEKSGQKPVPRLKLELIVRQGETGLVRLERDMFPDPAWAGDSPELREFRLRAVDEFLPQIRSFFQNYQWLGPEGDTGGPGFYTEFGRLAEPPADPDLTVHFRDKNKTFTWVRRLSKSQRRTLTWLPENEPYPAWLVIRNYYEGTRLRSEPLTLAGHPGWLKMQYSARPGLFLARTDLDHLSMEWVSADFEKFPYKIHFSDSIDYTPAVDRLRNLGWGRAIINSFRYVGGDSNDASSNQPPPPEDVGDSSNDTSSKRPSQPENAGGGSE